MPVKKFPKKLRVMAEYASSGIWVIEPVGPFRHYMIAPEALGLPANLAEQFADWVGYYWKRLEGGSFDDAQFNAIGRKITKELKEFIGAETFVEYVPEMADGSLGVAEEIT